MWLPAHRFGGLPRARALQPAALPGHDVSPAGEFLIRFWPLEGAALLSEVETGLNAAGEWVPAATPNRHTARAHAPIQPFFATAPAHAFFTLRLSFTLTQIMNLIAGNSVNAAQMPASLAAPSTVTHRS